MSSNHDKVVFPDFEKIMENCKKIMLEKFPDYKNSWTTLDYDLGTGKGDVDYRFWQKRLKDEFEEFLNAKTISEARKELEDIINICAMIHEQCVYKVDHGRGD